MNPADELLAVRDLLRYAVSRFSEAGLSYGHGTASAIDEAAFILLEGLRLPIDDINPWLDARLTRDERERLLGLIARRVETREPAPYLLGRAYMRGIPFRVDPRVIVPRSYLGELLLDGAEILPDEVASVLDLCTGSGALAIIAAKVFPDAKVDAVELSSAALEVARLNRADHGLQDRIQLLEGDLFAPVEGRRYDLIISNPPYVAAAEVAAFPLEHRHEPELAHLGGDDGLDLVRRILGHAGDHLNPGGGLLCEVGTGRELLDLEYPDLPFIWLDTEGSEGEVFWLSARDLGVS